MSQIIESQTRPKEDRKRILTSTMNQPNTKEGMENVYKVMTGNKAPPNISIDELDDRIMKVAIGGGLAQPGSTAARVAQAMLMGLGTKRETAMLKAGVGKSGGGKTVEPFQNAVIRLAQSIMTSVPGTTIEEAMAQATQQVTTLYGGTGVPTSPGTTPAPPANMTTHKDANDAAKKAGKNFYTINGKPFKVQ